MPSDLPKLYLARHGDTAWTDSHQHTGRTDLPLNEQGEQHARQLGGWLRQFSFTCVFTSPLLRASKTCELAGFGVGQRSIEAVVVPPRSDRELEVARRGTGGAREACR